MRILLTNDDGYRALGINILFNELVKVGFDVTMVAPKDNMSVSSSALSVGRALKLEDKGGNKYCVNGTPADCVHIALCGPMKNTIDIVISGINDVMNCGDDVIYSGTVGGAIEGRFLGVPSMAVSMDIDGYEHYNTGAQVVIDLLDKYDKTRFYKQTILNVNVPNIEYEKLNGYKSTRLGYRHVSEDAIKDIKQEGVYYIGPVGKKNDNISGTDFHAISNNYVSVTPLGTDITKFEMLNEMDEWLQK